MWRQKAGWGGALRASGTMVGTDPRVVRGRRLEPGWLRELAMDDGHLASHLEVAVNQKVGLKVVVIFSEGVNELLCYLSGTR